MTDAEERRRLPDGDAARATVTVEPRRARALMARCRSRASGFGGSCSYRPSSSPLPGAWRWSTITSLVWARARAAFFWPIRPARRRTGRPTQGGVFRAPQAHGTTTLRRARLPWRVLPRDRFPARSWFPAPPGPGRQARRVSKAAQLRPQLGAHVPGCHDVHPGHASALRTLRLPRPHPLPALLLTGGHLAIAPREECQQEAKPGPLVRRALAGEGACPLRAVGLQGSECPGRSPLGSAFARDQGRQQGRRPGPPKSAEPTLPSLQWVSARSLGTRCFLGLRVCPQATRGRVTSRKAPSSGGGTKLGGMSPWAHSAALQAASRWSVFVPGRRRRSGALPMSTATVPTSPC
jgi:hypothetical protein